MPIVNSSQNAECKFSDSIPGGLAGTGASYPTSKMETRCHLEHPPLPAGSLKKSVLGVKNLAHSMALSTTYRSHQRHQFPTVGRPNEPAYNRGQHIPELNDWSSKVLQPMFSLAKREGRLQSGDEILALCLNIEHPRQKLKGLSFPLEPVSHNCPLTRALTRQLPSVKTV